MWRVTPIFMPHEPALMKLPTFFHRRRHLLLSLVLTAVAVPLALEAVESRAQPVDGTQTLVFLRHGEKPGEGLGQLNCQGLNRALDLATVLPERFGKADYVFAANPHGMSKKAAGTKATAISAR